jgi:hypothetical protein
MSPQEWAKKGLEELGLSASPARLAVLALVFMDAMSAQREVDAKMAEWYRGYTGPVTEDLPYYIRNSPLGTSYDGPPL